jgi:tRNA (adenine37-N6)-methyltransferase
VQPVGRVVCSYQERLNVPKQPTIFPKNNTGSETIYLPPELGKIVLFPGYEECLCDLDGFDYIWVIALMHRNKGFRTKIRPQPVPEAEKRPPEQVGLFSSRAPHRPNPLALSALKIHSLDISQGTIYVEGLDLLNDTPILDIKPYIPAFDAFPEARAGWMDLIRSDYLEARRFGYQSIVSSRGARATRAGIRKQLQQEDS